MRTVIFPMVTIAWISVIAGISIAAECDIKGYDQTAPAAIKDTVTQSADFEWATDADAIQNGMRVWHYILNRDTSPLKYKWEKANLENTVEHPMPSGAPPACRRIFV